MDKENDSARIDARKSARQCYRAVFHWFRASGTRIKRSVQYHDMLEQLPEPTRISTADMATVFANISAGPVLEVVFGEKDADGILIGEYARHGLRKIGFDGHGHDGSQSLQAFGSREALKRRYFDPYFEYVRELYDPVTSFWRLEDYAGAGASVRCETDRVAVYYPGDSNKPVACLIRDTPSNHRILLLGAGDMTKETVYHLNLLINRGDAGGHELLSTVYVNRAWHDNPAEPVPLQLRSLRGGSLALPLLPPCANRRAATRDSDWMAAGIDLDSDPEFEMEKLFVRDKSLTEARIASRCSKLAGRDSRSRVKKWRCEMCRSLFPTVSVRVVERYNSYGKSLGERDKVRRLSACMRCVEALARDYDVEHTLYGRRGRTVNIYVDGEKVRTVDNEC